MRRILVKVYYIIFTCHTYNDRTSLTTHAHEDAFSAPAKPPPFTANGNNARLSDDGWSDVQRVNGHAGGRLEEVGTLTWGEIVWRQHNVHIYAKEIGLSHDFSGWREGWGMGWGN